MEDDGVGLRHTWKRTLVAVNDAPVAAVVEGAVTASSPRRAKTLDAELSDYRVSLGLAWSLPLR